jgi:5-methyltetrahydropteroyltriglutamate--homocysteine methyltransferase
MNARAPFRADQVGSLLRPPALKAARAAVADGSMDATQLRAVENDCIRAAVAAQEALGLAVVTDGEFRRAWWHFDFLAGLEGVRLVRGDKAIQFHGVTTKAESIEVHERVGFDGHAMVEDFKFLGGIAKVTPKMTLPAPSVLHFRGGRAAISRRVYPDLERFFEDTAEAYRKVVTAFYAAGCRYLQFDDTVWAYLCSDKERAAARERGDDPEPLPRIYAEMINHALADKPADLVVTTHVCRGNFRSSWIAEGGYEPVAGTLLAGTAYDGYFLEYDSERAGGFEPLRYLPRGHKRVVLGLVTSKFGDLESVEQLQTRIDEAARFVPREQLCLSPQCGFASTEEGNLLSEEQQWAKLARVVEVARATWQDAP